MGRDPVETKWYKESPIQRPRWTSKRERRERIRWNRVRRRMNHLQRYLVRGVPGAIVAAKQLTHWRR